MNVPSKQHAEQLHGAALPEAISPLFLLTAAHGREQQSCRAGSVNPSQRQQQGPRAELPQHRELCSHTTAQVPQTAPVSVHAMSFGICFVLFPQGKILAVLQVLYQALNFRDVLQTVCFPMLRPCLLNTHYHLQCIYTASCTRGSPGTITSINHKYYLSSVHWLLLFEIPQQPVHLAIYCTDIYATWLYTWELPFYPSLRHRQ